MNGYDAMLSNAWERHCAEQESEPYVCRDCGAALDPDEHGEIEAHREEHWTEWVRSFCPIPAAPSRPRPKQVIVIDDDDEEVPF